MTKIAGIAGSLREGSFNRALLRAAVELTPDDFTIDVVPIHDIPIYDGDVEEEGMPAAVEAAKEMVADADGLLIVTPEYNNSMPGVLKNAIDWMTRPPGDMKHVFRGKPVGVIGATPGGWGTKLSQTAWLPVWRALRMVPFYERSLYLSRARDKFEDGELTDDDTRERLRTYLETFGEFVRR